MPLLSRKQKVIDLFDRLASNQKLGTKFRYYHRYVNAFVCHLIPSAKNILELGCGAGDLLALFKGENKTGIEISPETIQVAQHRHPELDIQHGDAETLRLTRKFDLVLMVNLIGMLDDIQATLEKTHAVLEPNGRLLLVYYNHWWAPILSLASRLGLRIPIPEENWLPREEVKNLLFLADYQIIRDNNRLLLPLYIPLISWLVNRFIAPLPFIRKLGLIEYIVARPQPHPERSPASTIQPGCSIIIPTKDEKGNIQAAIERTPNMGESMELIFVDGNSTDGTIEEIQRMIKKYPQKNIIFMSQGNGKGKADAVRKGFDRATREILMILDSDLTMPPEDLPKYYQAIASGQAEFANGCRLVYPMEKEAMRLLNKIANHFFGFAFSWLLEQRIRDTLCGTKVLTRENYQKISRGRAYFGDFDPFGDFDLLFGAARLNLKIVDIPIRYRERTYGEIKIHRWKHGWLLLKMLIFAARKLKFVSPFNH